MLQSEGFYQVITITVFVVIILILISVVCLLFLCNRNIIQWNDPLDDTVLLVQIGHTLFEDW